VIGKETVTDAVIGRAKFPSVLADGPEAPGAITSVDARVVPDCTGTRVRTKGLATFDATFLSHIRNVILPTEDGITRCLGVEEKQYEMSVANVGAASAMGVGIDIKGLSAGPAALLALLSADLGMPVPQNVVCTGHVGSLKGDIRVVENIPAKMLAAAADPDVTTFIYPALDGDASFSSLSPMESERVRRAVRSCHDDLEIVAVKDVFELVQAVFPDQAVVEGALRTGFFGNELQGKRGEGCLTETACYLVTEVRRRFMSVLERLLLSGETTEAKRLLAEWAKHYVCKGEYPTRTGGQFLRLIHSLPPSVRRLKLTVPLLDVATCIQLSQFAASSDYDDVLVLFRLADGRSGSSFCRTAQTGAPTRATWKASGPSRLDGVLAELDRDALTKNVALPIDAARACYVADAVTVQSDEEFLDAICAFYLHMLRHTGSVFGTADTADAGAEALALLERSFARRGGRKAALAEARTGNSGGLRFVFDLMTECHKQLKLEDHVRYVLAEAMDSADYDAKVNLMAAFLKRHKHELPTDIASTPPARFANHWDDVVRAYCESMTTLTARLRAL
jgi:hypothetical protein